MIIGTIIGKVTTHQFKLEVTGKANKFDYVQILHPAGYYVLAQVVELERDDHHTVGYCNIIGYRDKGLLKGLNTPLAPGSKVLKATDEFVKDILGLNGSKHSAYLGVLEGRDKLKVHLDLNKMLTRHVFITAKTGAGKSYTVGVLLEEMLENKIPIVIIDPHGEYNTLKYPNIDHKEDLSKWGLKPKGYIKQIQEFSPDRETNPEAKALKLSYKNLSSTELIHLLPAKLTNTQKGLLYAALKNLTNESSLNDIIFEIETSEDNPSKWTLINILEYVKKLNLFSESPTLMSELVQPGKASIINLKGVAPDIQEVIVYKLVNDLFMARKKGNVSPFFLVVEEAQLFCPERSFGETKSSNILRQIASEGRKFGLGMAIITQRPARVDKNVISQAGTQIILKVTNPNDIKAVTNSVEGITTETEKEIKNLPIGTALVTGIVDLPLFVQIRTRRTKHGGTAINILNNEFLTESEDSSGNDSDGDIKYLIKQKITKKDRELMSDDKISLKTVLVPCAYFKCKQQNKEFNLLIDLHTGKLIKNVDPLKETDLPKLSTLSPQQSKVFQIALNLKRFKPAELFAKSKLQFSELYDIIQILTQKGYLEKNEMVYELKDKVKKYANLKDYAIYEKPDYFRINPEKQLDEKYDLDNIKKNLSKFVTVIDLKRCWLELFEP